MSINNNLTPNQVVDEIKKLDDDKVTKINGKGLSTEDYTTADQTKLAGIEVGAEVNTVTGVKGDSESTYRTGNINITKTNIGLGNVENKNSATIRSELTKSNVTTALGYTPPETDTNTTYSLTQDETDGHIITLTPSSGAPQTITIPDDGTIYTAGDGLSLSGTEFSNSGVRSIATGDSNGTIKVNTNGTSTDINVKGLSNAAYKDVDTTIADSSTSTKLPTSQAVASFVEGKGYKTTDTNTTYTLSADTTNNQIKLVPSSGNEQSITVPYATSSNSANSATNDGNGDEISTTYYKASNPNGYTSNIGTITKVQANGTDVASSGTANIPAASTNDYGVTKLSSATDSTSTTLAATPSAVKAAYDLANSKTSNTGTITGVSVNGTSVATSGVADITSIPASILSGAIPNGVTATTQSQGDNSTKVATTEYVDTAIGNLPDPMVFKGSLGTGGTITTLPTASSSNIGYTYKVITDGTYDGQSAKIGDTFVSDGTAWILIPSGDEPSGTVTSVTLKATSPIAIDSTSAITSSGTRTLSHSNSGVAAGTYKSVTVNATGHVTGGTNPTTISGYGITDAKIASGTITLGSNTITPLTSDSTLNAAKLSGAITNGVTATTQSQGDNSTKVATTKYVDTGLGNKLDAIELTSPVRIWGLDAGKIYKLPQSCTIYYYGATNTSNYISISSTSYLFITQYSTTYKGFFVFATSSSTSRYLYNGYSTSTSGNYTQFSLGTTYLTSHTYTSAICTTTASTAAKTANCSNYVLTANNWFHITIGYANSYNGAITLNINNTGAKPIYINGNASSSSNHTLPAGTYLAYYDGTNYYFRTDGKLEASITGDAATVNGKTVGVNVPSDAVFTDTTYENKTATSGGTDVSLVTTGEKYNWNNKSNLTIGTTSTTAAAGDHYHTISLNGDTGSWDIGLGYDKIYKLTAGGDYIKFKMPSDNNTTYSLTQDGTDGHKITLTPSSGTAQTITIPDNNTTYSAGTGLSLSGTTINHSNSITSGTIGTSSATSGSTISVPYATYDAQGHITGKGTHTHTITGFATTDVATSSANGLMSSTDKAKLDGIKITIGSTVPTSLETNEIYIQYFD